MEDQSAPTSFAPTAPITAATQPSPTVFNYRAYPLAVGYALATLVFGLAAWRERGKAVAVAPMPEEPATPTRRSALTEEPSIPLVGDEPPPDGTA